MSEPELRMDAYYYGFTFTGVREIDLILSAVACAGKAYHHTDYWSEETPAYDGHEGATPVDWIQNAADKAAAAWNRRAFPASGEREGDSKSELLRDHKQALAEWKEKHFSDMPKIGTELATPTPSPAPAGELVEGGDYFLELLRVQDCDFPCKEMDWRSGCSCDVRKKAADRIEQQAAKIRRLTAERDEAREAQGKAETDCGYWAVDFDETNQSLLAWKARAEQAEREMDSLQAGEFEIVLSRVQQEHEAALAALEADGWRPIETAPKDGTFVLVANEQGAWVAAFKEFAQSGYRFPVPWRSMMLNHRHMPQDASNIPTHWRPLPPPPQGEKA